MRAPSPTIPAPPFPRGLTWINSAPLRMDKQKGRPVLLEFCKKLTIVAHPTAVQGDGSRETHPEEYKSEPPGRT